MGDDLLTLGGKTFSPRHEAQWSQDSLSLSSFWNNYGSSLPSLIRVNEGYHGAHGFDVYGAEETLHITTSSSQQRVVAKDLSFDQGYISIPYDSPVMFTVVDDKKPTPKPKHLSDILKKHKLPVTVRLASEANLRFFISADVDCYTKFHSLSIFATYHERYLLGNPVADGEIFTEKPCSLPVYLPLKVSVALGPKNNKVASWEWSALKLKMAALCKKCDYTKHPMNKDWMLYNTDDVDRSDGIYEALMPKHMVKRMITTELEIGHMYSELGATMKNTNRSEVTPVIEQAAPQCQPNIEDSIQTGKTESSADTKNKEQEKVIKEINEKLVSEVTTWKLPSVNPGEGLTNPTNVSEPKPVAQNTPPTEDHVPNEQLVNSATEPATSAAVKQDHPETPVKSPEQTTDTTVKEPNSTNTGQQGPRSLGSIKAPPRIPPKPGTAKRPINKIADIPKVAKDLTVKELAECVKLLKMEELAQQFQDQQVNGALLCELETSDLQQEFGIGVFAAKKLYLFARDRWRPDSTG